jgi:hypothetical protein
MNREIYTRQEFDNGFLVDKQATVSQKYWLSQAREIFYKFPWINVIEKVDKKSNSKFMKKGSYYAPKGMAIIIPSTGGRWGKSRQNYISST